MRHCEILVQIDATYIRIIPLLHSIPQIAPEHYGKKDYDGLDCLNKRQIERPGLCVLPQLEMEEAFIR
jgi:hypothetical protein